jgi:hypothetical protein
MCPPLWKENQNAAPIAEIAVDRRTSVAQSRKLTTYE